MKDELFYQLALTAIPGIGPVQARILAETLGNASAIFTASINHLEKIEGIGRVRASAIRRFKEFSQVEKELKFIERFNIQCLFLNDARYPSRLLQCYDPPTVLYYKGNADLNTSKIISIIGTRMNTSYGRQSTEQLIKELASTGALIISGLALGIDTIVHKTAMKSGLLTAGVLAHGLDTIYPHQNNKMAREMLLNGGLLTEFMSNTKPDKHHFPNRNRIVAGICDALVLIETGIKGGSMITAELANGYNRDVFAIPGRNTDSRSAGCNKLIATNKAALISNAGDLISYMGWDEFIKEQKTEPGNRQLILENILPEEKAVLDALNNKPFMHIDELRLETNISSGMLASVLLNLELRQLLIQVPGNCYKSSYT